MKESVFRGYPIADKPPASWAAKFPAGQPVKLENVRGKSLGLFTKSEGVWFVLVETDKDVYSWRCSLVLPMSP